MKKHFSLHIFILPLVAALFLISAIEVSAEVKAGYTAPGFALEDINGKTVSLSSFKGKPVLLNFWATWCPYCRKERAHLSSLYEKYREKDLVVISISTDSSVEKLKRFMKDNPAPFIVLSDSGRMAAPKYGIKGLPTSFLVDRNGKVVRELVGYRPWTDKYLTDIIDGLVVK